METHSESEQAGLFPEDPPPNSPEDLGFVKPPPPGTLEKLELPPMSTLPIEDANKFLDWLDGQDDVKKSGEISLIAVLEAFSGLSRGDLKWLCGAIHQAGKAPDPGTMKKATLARDVALLR